MSEKCECVNVRKVVIVGCGFVGSASAFALMQSGLFSEMVLIDVDKDRAEGEAMDISHGASFAGPMKIYAGGYEDLVQKNAKIMTDVVTQIKEQEYKGILLIVSNPVDIMTQVAMEVSGFPEHRVFGSGTVLDSARLRYHLGQHLGVDSRSVHAFVIGEHGDSEIAAWSSANVSGVPLNSFCEMRGHYNHEGNTESIEEQVKNSAYEIIAKKDATYYGIAMVVKRICQAIVRDEKSIFPISLRMHGEYALEDVVLSMPAIVGARGIETTIPISLDEKEVSRLHESAEMLRETRKEIR